MTAIIYQSDLGVAVLMAAPECGLSILEVGQKDVPAGVPFWIVNREELPDAPQETWELNDMPKPDGVGGTYKGEANDQD